MHTTPYALSLIKGLRTKHLYLFAITVSLASVFWQISFLIDAAQIVTDSFIKIFRCVSLPIISLSLITTLATLNNSANLQKIGRKTLFYTLLTTLIAAGVTCVLYCVIAPATIASQAAAPVVLQDTSYGSYLGALLPSNVFAPFIEQHVMGVLLMSLVVGLAISFIPDEKARETISSFFKGAHGLFFVITGWIVNVIPLALFGFITTTLVQLQSGANMTGLTQYLLVIVLANVVQGFVVLPIFLRWHAVQPFKAMKGMLPALSVAFFSKSSTGALPITMATIEKNLNVAPQISRLTLPLCTSINMNGCAAFIFATVLYVMQNNGVEVSFATFITWILIATIAAIGNAGVPMGCFFLSASLLTSMHQPIGLLGLILPFYGLIDMIETALNVWSDACVTKVIDKKLTPAATQTHCQKDPTA